LGETERLKTLERGRGKNSKKKNGQANPGGKFRNSKQDHKRNRRQKKKKDKKKKLPFAKRVEKSSMANKPTRGEQRTSAWSKQSALARGSQGKGGLKKGRFPKGGGVDVFWWGTPVTGGGNVEGKKNPNAKRWAGFPTRGQKKGGGGANDKKTMTGGGRKSTQKTSGVRVASKENG